MSTLFLLISLVAAIGLLVCFVLVLIQMFKRGQTDLGILCIVLVCCTWGELIAFVYGWINAKAWNTQNIMLAWTLCWAVSIVAWLMWVATGAATFPAEPSPAPAEAPASSPPAESRMTAEMTAVGTAPLEMAVEGPRGVAPASRSAQASPAGGQPGAAYQKADAGVGVRGRGYGPGLITTPVAVYFSARERIVFETQLPQAMKRYKANSGNTPKTQEEFMQRIIQENQIKLPDLPPGERYLYDPAREELLVEYPAR